MDGRDDMSLPQSYYMQRGLSGPVTQSGFNGLSGMQFQSNIGTSSIGLLPTELSLPVSPHNNNVSVNMPLSESLKRKRGRPRKYGADHGGVSLALSPLPSAPPAMITSSPKKRGRGRPLGSGKKKQLLPSLGDWLSGSAGKGFTPHVIAIAAGDDITTKIMSFSQQGHRAICILSANGSVSSVTLRQPSTSGGTVTYEGRFEILCLSGSYLLTDNAASRNQSGGLNVTLASPDGRVIGGGVGGMLIAASPIQVIVGSFLCSDSRTKNKRKESTNGAAVFSDIQTFENPITAANVQLLNPGSLMDVWPGSRAVDMRNSHIDIDLMRR